MSNPDVPSTRPYLIRALYEWCTDNGLTPYVAVAVDDSVQVPREYVKNGEIVLNISFDATSALKLGNEFLEFKARFAGVAREICVPVQRVIAIYARENGQGMAFPAPSSGASALEPAGGRATPAGAGKNGVAGSSDPVQAALSAPTGPGRPTEAHKDTGSNAPRPTEHGVVVTLNPEATQTDGGGDRPSPPRPSGPHKPSLRRIK